MNLSKSLRPLLIVDYLHRFSSANNIKNSVDIAAYLFPYFGTVDRKTISTDISHLKQAGFHIHSIHANNRQGVYLDNDCLTLAQVKIILDALTSNQFIPSSLSQSILQKLKPLIKDEDIQILLNQQYIPPNHNANDNLLPNIDTLMHAIALNQTIQFKYFDLTSNKKKRYRKDGKYYSLQPYFIFMNASRYYVIGYANNHNALVHYRLDKMDTIVATNINETRPLYDQVHKRIETSISLFTGEYQNVTFKIKPKYLSVFVDQFNDIMLLNETNDFCVINVTLQVNASLFAWITHFDPDDVLIVEPQLVKEQYKNHLKKIWSSY